MNSIGINGIDKIIDDKEKNFFLRRVIANRKVDPIAIELCSTFVVQIHYFEWDTDR